MANVIDSRVVEMKFNNSQFEHGVQQTLATLAKLKDSLNFEGAVKGLTDIGAAAKNLTFDAIGSAVDSASAKFNALHEIAVGALRRIGDEAAGAALKLVDFSKSLSIDQIGNGFDKYAQKTSSVQTIMAATADQFSDTGEQMEYVNEQLDKLNWFTDETSYNFLDMVSSIGKFTSNGIELEKAVTAMQGISNWAAISGQSKNEASRAMYNLSQALAVGEVKLMDWRSIENANMATKEFKEKVLEAAEANGKLRKTSEGVYKTIGKGTEVTIENFSNSLSEGWFDSGTLMDVLDQYGNVTDKLYDLSTQTGATATDILTLVEAQQKGRLSTAQLADVLGDEATPSSIASLRKGIEDLASAENEFGIKTFRAAQEAKTFEEAIGSVEDAVSTGWMQSFELIFGDYEKARVLWTDVANNMWDIFAGGSEDRNEFLKDWASSGWEKLNKDVKRAGVSTKEFEAGVKRYLTEAGYNVRELIDEYGSLGAAIEATGAIAAGDFKYAVKETINDILRGSGSLETAEERLEAIQKAVNDVWSGALGNGDDRKKALEEMGFSYDTIQNLVNKGADYVVQLEDLTDEELKAIGLGEEEIELLRSIQGDEERLLSIVGQKGGRELFGEAINQGLVDIVQTLTLLKSTWSEVMGSLEAGTLRDWTEKLRDWTQNIALYEENEEGVEVLTERGSIFKQMLEKVFTAARNTFDVFQNGVRLFSELVSSASPAIEAVNGLAEALINLYNAGSGKFADFLSDLDFSDRLTPLAERAAGIIDGITEKIDSFRRSVQSIGDIRAELEQLGEGGGVDLLHRPVVDAKLLSKYWGDIGDGIATLYSSTYSNKSGTKAINFTPILVDENGHVQRVLSPKALQRYAEAVIDGVQEDYLHLQIGAAFEGDDAIRRAEEAAERIHEIHEDIYSAGSEETYKLVDALTMIRTIVESSSSIFETIANASMDIAEAFVPVGDALGNLGLTTLREFAGIMERLAPMLENIRKAFNPLINTIGEDLASAINWISDGLSNIDLDSVFGKLSQVFGKLVPIVTNVWTIIKNIGSTIGTVFKSLSPVLEPISNIFLKVLDIVGKLSGKLAELSGKAAKGLEPVFKTVGDALTKVFETIDKLLGNFKISDIFEKIGNAFTKAGEITGGVGEKFKTFFDGLIEGNTLSETFGSIWDWISGIFDKVKTALDPVLKSIKENLGPIKENLDKFWKSVVEGFDFKDAKTMGDYVEKFFSGIGNIATSALKGLIDGLSKIDFSMIFKGITAAKVMNKILYFKTMIEDLLSTFKSDGLSGLGQGLFDWIFGDFSMEQMADSILKFAKAIGILTIALVALSLIPTENLTKGIEAMVAALMSVIVPLTIIYKYVNVSQGWFGFQMMATAFLEAAVAVLVLAGALAAFSAIAEHMDATGGIEKMVESMGALALVLGLLGKYGGGGLNLIGVATSMLIASAALIVLAGALAAFCAVVKIFGAEAGPALVLMGTMLGGVTLALIALSNAAVQSLIGAAALLVAAVAVTALAGAIAVWALVVENFDVAAALLAMAAAFLVVGAAMAAFGSGVGVILAGALALAGASVAIVLFSAALAAFLLVLQLAEPALTALSNGFSALGTGLQELLTGLGEGLMAFIAGIGAGIGEAIGGLFEGIGEGIGAGIAGVGAGIALAEEAIGAGFESMSNKIGESTESAGTKIQTGLTSISEGIGKIGESFSGLASGIADIGTSLGTFSTNVAGLGLLDLVKIGTGLKSVADGIKKLNDNPFTDHTAEVLSYANALNSLSEVVTTLTSVGENLKSLATSIAQGMMQNFAHGIQNGVSTVNSVLNSLASVIRASFRALPYEFVNIGYQISSGLAQGIRNGQYEVTSAAQSVATAAKTAAEETLVINSPSKVFAEIGQYMALGMAKGLEDSEGSVTSASEILAKDAIDSAQSEMSRFASIFGTDAMSPVITPILDLSNAMAGASQLSNTIRGLNIGGSLGGYDIDANRIDYGARSMNATSEIQKIQGYIDDLGAKIENIQIVLDTGTLVGATSAAMDNQFGVMTMRRGRGN